MRQKGSCRNREVMPDDMSGKDEGQSISDPEDPSALTQDLEELLTFANAGAALITLKKGAIRSMPKKEEIRKFLEDQKIDF